jgi:hypothetical protein
VSGKSNVPFAGRLSFYTDAQLIYSRYKPSPIFQIGCIGEGLFPVIECTGFYQKTVVFPWAGFGFFSIFFGRWMDFFAFTSLLFR